MIIKREWIEDAGTCDFCKKGKLVDGRLIYPYKQVVVISGGKNSIKFCEECFGKVQSTKPEEIE